MAGSSDLWGKATLPPSGSLDWKKRPGRQPRRPTLTSSLKRSEIAATYQSRSRCRTPFVWAMLSIYGGCQTSWHTVGFKSVSSAFWACLWYAGYLHDRLGSSCTAAKSNGEGICNRVFPGSWEGIRESSNRASTHQRAWQARLMILCTHVSSHVSLFSRGFFKVMKRVQTIYAAVYSVGSVLRYQISLTSALIVGSSIQRYWLVEQAFSFDQPCILVVHTCWKYEQLSVLPHNCSCSLIPMQWIRDLTLAWHRAKHHLLERVTVWIFQLSMSLSNKEKCIVPFHLP